MNTIRLLRLAPCVAVFALALSPAHGQSAWCEAAPPQPPPLPPPVAAGGGALFLGAARMDVLEDDRIVLLGDAVMRQGAFTVRADDLEYRRSERRVTVDGTLELFTAQGDHVRGRGAGFVLHDAQEGEQGAQEGGGAAGVALRGHINDVDYVIARRAAEGADSIAASDSGAASGGGGRGSAARLQLADGDRIILEDTRYTWCPPGKDDVVIRASRLTLDHAAGVGVARHATLRFKNVPVLYLPYLGFPISDQRKSGFLLPEAGYDGVSGLVVKTPYYLNLAPALDATVRPGLHARRGPQLGGELRYLLADGEGVLDGTALPDDEVFGGRDRWAVDYRHRQRFHERLRGEVTWRKVSDGRYFDDFDGALDDSGLSWLPANARLSYRAPRWRLQTGVSAWNRTDDGVDPVNAPHNREPYLHWAASSPQRSGKPYYAIDTAVTRFTHDHRIGGRRLVMRPSLGLRAERPWGQLGARLGLHSTRYDLDSRISTGGGDGNGAADDTLSRNVPMFSADGGLLFRRHIAAGRKVQTLEPRLFYTWIPPREQRTLPSFDTVEAATDSYEKLFLDNLFLGPDRTEDANRVTLGLTSRVLDAASGAEKWRASLGRVFHLGRRRDAQGAVVSSDGVLAGELAAVLSPGWSARGFVEWDSESRVVAGARAALAYAPTATGAAPHLLRRAPHLLRLTYHHDRLQRIEQLRLNLRWSPVPRWELQFNEWYSLERRRNDRTDAALVYNGCCWQLAIGARQRRVDDGASRNSLFITFGLRTGS